MLQLAGPLSGHMAQHIVLMNLLAPLVVLGLSRRLPLFAGRTIVPASTAQLLLLWGWHAPAALEIALAVPALDLLMQLSLFAAALWFWAAIIAIAGEQRWQAIVALLATSKLFCLLGVLLVFSPRALYAITLTTGHLHGRSVNLVADQQFAGLLMLVACPATYLIAGVVIAASWLGLLDRQVAPLARNGDG